MSTIKKALLLISICGFNQQLLAYNCDNSLITIYNNSRSAITITQLNAAPRFSLRARGSIDLSSNDLTILPKHKHTAQLHTSKWSDMRMWGDFNIQDQNANIVKVKFNFTYAPSVNNFIEEPLCVPQVTTTPNSTLAVHSVLKSGIPAAADIIVTNKN